MSNNWFLIGITQWVDRNTGQWQPTGTVVETEMFIEIAGSKPKTICDGVKTHIDIKARDAKILMSGY
jgi:hypothetical protein